MKSTFTGLRLFVVSLLLIAAVGLSAQTTIWGGPGDPNGEFDGGLNDWTAIGVSSFNPDSSGNALWVWDADGAADQGSFWGARSNIASPSRANGTALFNSDFLDNGGGGIGGLGTGSAPAGDDGTTRFGHRGELISPKIDCSANSTVGMSFSQYYRRLTVTAADGATCSFVDVSNDDGQTWTAFPLNEDIGGNAETDSTAVALLDISSVAAESADVRIRFRWDGYYYFWLVDDVWLFELPDNNLAISPDSIFYSPRSFATPACHLQDDTLVFTTTINNLGGADQTNVVFKGEIVNELGAAIWVDSLVLGVLPVGVDTNVALTNSFVPGILDVGQYFMVYSTYSLDGDDFNPVDNAASVDFLVTEDIFSKENGMTIGFRPGSGGDWSSGAYYRTSPLCQESYIVDGIQFGVAVNEAADGPLSGKETECYILKVTDDTAPDFSNFDVNAIYQDGLHPNLEIIGFAIYPFTDDDQEFTILNIEGDQFIDFTYFDTTQVDITPDNRYFVLFNYVGNSNTIFHGFSETQPSVGQISTIVLSTQWFLAGFQGGPNAVTRMSLAMSTLVDETPLPENAVNLYPNPANDIVNIELSLEESVNTTITLADINGKVIRYNDYADLQKETIQMNTNDLAAGTYIVRIATEIGTKTKRFIVQK